MIRILQVFNNMGQGGAESMIMNYYRNIDRTEIQFDFLVHKNKKSTFDDEIERLGGNIYRMPVINPFYPFKYYKSLRQFFDQHKDYLIVHSHLNTFSYFPLKIAQEFMIPNRIAHAHTATEKIAVKDVLNPKTTKEALKKLVKLYLKQNIHKHTTHYMSCGGKAGNWLFGNKQPFLVMNNAIEAKKFIYNPVMSSTYKKEFVFENHIVIGHIGSFTNPKNHSYMLKVFKALLNENENCRLVLIGDGPLRKNIETEAEQLAILDKVAFLGLRTDISNLCQMMDLFIFPSFYEGLPVTLIEAQASGLKILASDTITKEVQITNDIKFLSINDSPKLWAQEALSLYPYVRKNNFNSIQKAGYDIKTNTNILQEFYQKKIVNL